MRLFALLLVVAGGCGRAAPPPTDSCATPSPGSVDRVEIGAAGAADLNGQPTPFAPLADGDGVPLVRGNQGANMIGLVFRISGASTPACLSQHTTILDGSGNKITSSSPPLATYAEPDGTRLTRPLWLPADYPMQFTVSVAAADKSLDRHLHLLLQ